MNALALLLLGIKPACENAPSQTRISIPDNSEGNNSFGEALLLALDTLPHTADSGELPLPAEDSDEQSLGAGPAILPAANPAAAFPFVNPMVQIAQGESSITDLEILPATAIPAGQDTAPVNQIRFNAPAQYEAQSGTALQPTAIANPASYTVTEAAQPDSATVLPSGVRQTLDKPLIQDLRGQLPADPSPTADTTRFGQDPTHANRQAVSVIPDTTPAPQQETPPADSGIWETEAAESVRISPNQSGTPLQAGETAVFTRAQAGSQPEALHRVSAEAETPGMAPEPRLEAKAGDYSAAVEKNPIESLPLENPEYAAGPSVSDDRAQITVQNLGAAEQTELPEKPAAAGETFRMGPPRESAEPMRARGNDTTEPQPAPDESAGMTGKPAEISAASRAQTGEDSGGRNPFQNPEAASPRAKAVEQSLFTALEESTSEQPSAIRQEAPPPTAPVTSGPVAEARNPAAPGTVTASNGAPDQARMVDQVVKAIHLSQRQGTTDLTVRLDPPELGTLHIKVSMTAGQLSAEVRAADHRIHQMISANQAEIHEALRQAGVRLEQITVPSYSSASGGFSHQEHHANWDNPGAQPGFSPNHFPSERGGRDDQSQPGHASGIRSSLLDTLA